MEAWLPFLWHGSSSPTLAFQTVLNVNFVQLVGNLSHPMNIEMTNLRVNFASISSSSLLNVHVHVKATNRMFTIRVMNINCITNATLLACDMDG